MYGVCRVTTENTGSFIEVIGCKRNYLHTRTHKYMWKNRLKWNNVNWLAGRKEMALLIFYNVLWQHSCQSFKRNNKIVNECCWCCCCKLIAGVQVFNLTIFGLPFFLVKLLPYRNLVHRFYHSTVSTNRLNWNMNYSVVAVCFFFQLRNETVNNWQANNI